MLGQHCVATIAGEMREQSDPRQVRGREKDQAKSGSENGVSKGSKDSSEGQGFTGQL